MFQGAGGFVELEHFNKYFVNFTRKKGSEGKYFGVFPLDTLKNIFWMEN